MAKPTNSGTSGSRKSTQKSIWKQLKMTESQHKMSRRIKAMDPEQKQQGLSSVTAPTGSDKNRCKTTMGAAQLEQVCLAEAGQRFTQATGMPFLSEPLCSIFKNHGMTTTAFQEVLEGTFQPPKESNPYAKKLLQALQKTPRITPIPKEHSPITQMLGKRHVK